MQRQMVARTNRYAVSRFQLPTLVKVSVTAVMDCQCSPVLLCSSAKLTTVVVPLQDNLPHFLEFLGTDIPLIFKIFLRPLLVFGFHRLRRQIVLVFSLGIPRHFPHCIPQRNYSCGGNVLRHHRLLY